MGCRGSGVVGSVGRYSMINETVIIRGWSTSKPFLCDPVGYHHYSLNFVLLYFLEDLQDYAKRWKTIIIGW